MAGKRSFVGTLEKDSSSKEQASVCARTPSTADCSKPDLIALLAKWKKILKLRDWDIRIKYARAYDLPEGKVGTSGWVARNASALIKILDPVDYSPDSVWPQDVEGTVVHELLHLHFAAIDDLIVGNLAGIVLEQAINRIENALTSLDRAKQRTTTQP